MHKLLCCLRHSASVTYLSIESQFPEMAREFLAEAGKCKLSAVVAINKYEGGAEEAEIRSQFDLPADIASVCTNGLLFWFYIIFNI